MNDKDYFSHLYDIASHLNKAFSLHGVLRISLEKTAEILNVETGWIWLTEPDNKSVYLAVSHNLPPALSNYPERLSGWCYCIKHYLSDDISQAMNISEIACSRLREVNSGTNDLKFHATIPIIINSEKVGLINLLSKETRKLDEKELTVLNTISQLIGTAIQRTRLQQSYSSNQATSDTEINDLLERVFQPRLETIMSCLDHANVSKSHLNEALNKAKELHQQLAILHSEAKKNRESSEANTGEMLYPDLPLTNRELEVLSAIKKGFTNAEIGEQLYITERTIKFHVSSILSKLHAKTRTEAVDIGLKRGFLSV